MLPMTEFGLMQITRERIRENILQSMHEPCPYCEGTGLVTKKSNVAHEIEEWLKRFKQENKSKPLILKIHPNLQDTLKRGRISFFSKLRFKYVFRLRMELDEKMSIQKFQFIDLRTGEDITDNYS